MAESADRELAHLLSQRKAVVRPEPAPLIERSGQFRSELLRAAFGGELPPIDAHERIVAFAAAAPANTLRALVADLRIADAYQARHNRPAFPLTPRALHLLIGERANAGFAKSSIDRLVASMVKLHRLLAMPSPVDDIVRWKQQEIRRIDQRPVRQARGLRLKGEVDDIKHPAHPVSLLGLLEHIPDDLAGLRDRALIAIGYDAGLRASELVPIQLLHITRLANGEASLFIPRSKTDQESEGTWGWLSRRAVRHLDAWLMSAQIEEGLIFRPLSRRVGIRQHIGEGTVSRILKGRLRTYLADLVMRGVIDSASADLIVKETSAHSVRVGCDQDLFAAGVDIGSIMQALRWTSPRQPIAYARHLLPATSKYAATMRIVGD